MKIRNKNLKRILPIVIISILLGSIVTAFAQPPRPMAMYGDVYVDTVLAGAGLNVYAKYGTTQIASGTTNANGVYSLSIPEESGVADGESIDLYVGTEYADTVLLEYNNDPLELDLYVTGGAPSEPDTGTLYITTTPNYGDVYIDTIFRGDAPVSYTLEVGTHTVSFGAMVGYDTPASQLAVVIVDATTDIEGIYVLKPTGDTGILSISTTPVSGEVFVDLVSWGYDPMPRTVAWGSYSVTYGAVTGYFTPGTNVINVNEDRTYLVAGLYELVPAAPTDDFSIDYVSADTADKGDVLTVIGSGVTAGTTVDVFWDYASGTYAHLLNTTDGNPDGTFECEITVPSDTVGKHYLWATDTSTGATVRYGPLTMVPKISLSPSSGLVGDEVTVKGYGFTAEANFTFSFGTEELTTDPTDVESDKDGYFTCTFLVPEEAVYGTYAVKAEDFYGFDDSADFVLGASITLTPDVGPTGIVVEVEGRGFTEDATISFSMDGTAVQVVDDDVVTVDSDGEFSAEIVVPDMDSKGDYVLEASESGGVKGPATEDFEVDGVPKLVVSPTYGTPGATVTVTGSNFTQIAGTEVTVKIGAFTVVTAKTDSDGSFEDTFDSPAIAFTTYDVIATDEYSIDADDAFKVGLIAFIINPINGEAGTRVSLTGIGFSPGDYNVTFGTELYAEHGTVSAAEALSDAFYVPNVEPGTYSITVIDVDANELTQIFIVTESTYVVADPAVAPNDYNISISGYNFADVAGAVTCEIYNSTGDWPMDVVTDPGAVPVKTDKDGNFTGYWMVDAVLDLGDYTINVTGSEGLLAQMSFSVVAARVDVAPRKALFDRGDMIQFNIDNDFKLEDSYIEIYDPYETLYWSTDPFVDAWWLLVEGLYTVPYYRQTAAENPMELQSDAPMGAWLYIFYDEDGDQLMNGTFAVGPSTAAQVDTKLTEIWDSIEGLTDNIDGITEDLEGDIGDLAGDIADVVSEMKTLRDDIVDDLADEISAATDAGKAASDAVADLEGALGDLEDSMSDIATISNSALDAAQLAADAAAAAASAAEESQGQTQGLTTLVYGAIGASLIAALAAIVSLMQISRRIAG